MICSEVIYSEPSMAGGVGLLESPTLTMHQLKHVNLTIPLASEILGGHHKKSGGGLD